MVGVARSCLFLFCGCLAGSPAFAADSLHFSVHKAIDENTTKHVASTYLIPKGWKATDVIRWNLMQRDAPLLVAFGVASPDKKFGINYINSLPHAYTRIPSTSAAKSTGVPPPQHPTDIVVDAFKSAHPGVEVEILDRKEVPEASMFRPMATQQTVALRCSVKFKYTLDGVPTVTVCGFDYQAVDFGTTWGRAHGFSNGNWYVNGMASVSGPENQLDKALRYGAVTLSSQRTDPAFYEFYQQVCANLSQQMMQETNEKLKASFDHMQEYFKDMSARSKEQFAQQMQAKDIRTRDICDYVLDRHRWSDGQNVFLEPNTYDHAFTNGSEIVLTSGPQYELSQDFHEMKKID